jgi:hypothetical protein
MCINGISAALAVACGKGPACGKVAASEGEAVAGLVPYKTSLKRTSLKAYNFGMETIFNAKTAFFSTITRRRAAHPVGNTGSTYQTSAIV